MEPIATNCPHCRGEILVSEGTDVLSCPACGQRLDVTGHFAFLRGLAAFDEGQELMQSTNPRKQRAAYPRIEKEALALFMEAYSSLQVAFQSDLAEVQRQVGVEMMSSMAGEFMKRGMVSPLEANYWNSVMVEQTAQEEVDRLRGRLAGSTAKAAFFSRWRWAIRIKQLQSAVAQTGTKIHALEQQIAFLEPPRARRKNWK